MEKSSSEPCKHLVLITASYGFITYELENVWLNLNIYEVFLLSKSSLWISAVFYTLRIPDNEWRKCILSVFFFPSESIFRIKLPFNISWVHTEFESAINNSLMMF